MIPIRKRKEIYIYYYTALRKARVNNKEQVFFWMKLFF